jgi:DNA modification methylase
MKYVPISSVIPNKTNPRFIKDDKFKKLVQSIKDFPQMLELRPIVVDSEMVVLGGNMRLKACQAAGLVEVPIIVAENLTHAQRQEFIIKDNVGFGEWDWDILANEWEMQDLQDWGLDLPFDNTPVLEAEEDDYEAPSEIKTDIVLGDLIEIGQHRLMCGDSTDSDAIAKLMDGKRAAMAFTSPPYNAGKSEALSGNTHSGDNKYNEYNDNQSKSQYLDLLIGFTNNAIANAEYLICNIQTLAGNKIALIEYLYQYKDNFIDVAIWDKGHGAPQMAANVMNSAWEYMFFISSKEKASRAIPGAKFKGNVPNIYRGKPQRNNEFSSVHAATFPIDLPEWGMQFTKVGDIVLDQFIGTGTTMVAAHQLNRKCFGMELDPKYCQVIVDRMHKLDPSLEIKINGKPYDK